MIICVDVHLVLFIICFKMKPLKLENKNIKPVTSLSESIEKATCFKWIKALSTKHLGWASKKAYRPFFTTMSWFTENIRYLS